MGLEIERKFLVTQPAIIEYADGRQRIRQGYLNTDIDRTVRVRTVKNNTDTYGTAWMTVKGRNAGCVRQEFEYQIPEEDGLSMLEMCEGGFIDKNRFIILNRDFTFEVDVFLGDNDGLIVAELEFEEDDELAHLSEKKLRPRLPEWLGEEVTDDERYYNSSLLKNPYTTWST